MSDVTIDGPTVGTVVEGLIYAKSLVKYIPSIMKEDDHRPFVKKISSEMRATQSETTRYIVLIVILQLSDFIGDAVIAFDESRPIMLPRPKNDVDFTVMAIWRQFNDATLNEYNKISDWHEADWNPYMHVQIALDKLATYIGRKHFAMEPVKEDTDVTTDDVMEIEEPKVSKKTKKTVK